MSKRPFEFAYGIKLIALWMLIPFLCLIVPRIYTEFSAHMTTQEVTLGEEIYSPYPDDYKGFKAEINGVEDGVHAPVTSKKGDKITVVLRNGRYYLTPDDEKMLDSYVSFGGRFARVTNNSAGYHVLGLAVALLICFLITVKKSKDIRGVYPKLAKSTNIIGIICSVLMSAAMIFYHVDGSLTSTGFVLIGLLIGIIYTAVFMLAWLIECLIMAFAKK